jgi:hypothetical protein
MRNVTKKGKASEAGAENGKPIYGLAEININATNPHN